MTLGHEKPTPDSVGKALLPAALALAALNALPFVSVGVYMLAAILIVPPKAGSLPCVLMVMSALVGTAALAGFLLGSDAEGFSAAPVAFSAYTVALLSLANRAADLKRSGKSAKSVSALALGLLTAIELFNAAIRHVLLGPASARDWPPSSLPDVNGRAINFSHSAPTVLSPVLSVLDELAAFAPFVVLALLGAWSWRRGSRLRRWFARPALSTLMAAHELRGSLGNVLNRLDILVPPDRVENLDSLRDEVLQQLNVLDRVLPGREMAVDALLASGDSNEVSPAAGGEDGSGPSVSELTDLVLSEARRQGIAIMSSVGAPPNLRVALSADDCRLIVRHTLRNVARALERSFILGDGNPTDTKSRIEVRRRKVRWVIENPSEEVVDLSRAGRGLFITDALLRSYGGKLKCEQKGGLFRTILQLPY
jgi:signal transduction histidine kinase